MEKNTSVWKYRIDFLACIVDDQSESEWTEIHGGYVEQKQNRNYTLFIFLFSFIVICTQVFFCASFENENNKKYIRLWSVSAFELYLPTSCDKLFDVVQKMFHVQCRFCTHRKYIRSFRLAFYMRSFRAWIVFRYREYKWIARNVCACKCGNVS